jgi:hypothetical protein
MFKDFTDTINDKFEKVVGTEMDPKTTQVIANIRKQENGTYSKHKLVNSIPELIGMYKNENITMLPNNFRSYPNNMIFYFLTLIYGKNKANKIIAKSTFTHNQRDNFFELEEVKFYNGFEYRTITLDDVKNDYKILKESNFKYNQYYTKPLKLLLGLGYEDFIWLMTILKNNDVVLHDFYENIHERTYENLYNPEFKKEFLLCIKNSVKNSNLIGILSFINYSRVRKAKNIKERLSNVHLLKLAMKDKISLIGKDNKEHYLFLNEENALFFKYSRSYKLINSIGKITNCCFRPDGLAKSLLEPAIKSPLSGIFTGSFEEKGDKFYTWFSFVWEFQEYDNKSGMITTSIVLDNLEASKTLTMSDWFSIKNYLERNTNYYRVYLGTMRNDIDNGYISTLEKYPGGKSIKSKPYSLVNYQKNFDSYSYDDSKEMYLITSNPIEEISNIDITRVDEGWLERICFMERWYWNDDNDVYLKNIDLENSISYAIHSGPNLIGYVLTEMSYYDSEENKLVINENKKYSKTIKEDETGRYKKCLYFTDILLPSNKHYIKALSYIFPFIEEWMKNNKIEYTSASMNENSKHFKKRLEKVSNFIKDTRFETPIYNRDSMSSPTDIVFSDDLKYNIKK